MPQDENHHDDRDPDAFALAGYRFDLPDAQIARYPAPERTGSRLMHVPAAGPFEHLAFPDVAALVRPGDCLVLNNTQVIPARLQAHRAGSGGRLEVLLARPVADDPQAYVCLIRPSRRMKSGERIVFTAMGEAGDEPFFATVAHRLDDEPGAFLVRFEGNPVAYAEHCGTLPLPPYLEREAEVSDFERYQTVYANPAHKGAAAAPTAGLHFTPELLDSLRARGVQRAEVTLHTGPGTFLPVRDDDIRTHQMHMEPWFLDASAAKTLNETRQNGGRIVAVGTTAVRVLESAVRDDGTFAAGAGETRIFITPGYRFSAVDALVTNFHLSESTLLMLVAAFSGRPRILEAYRAAVDGGYRFFSYGDACFLERSASDGVDQAQKVKEAT